MDLRVPPTLVTNNPVLAREFADGRSLVAKALSPGVGIAPFVAEVKREDLDLVAGLPTLLQERVEARADLRVVTVADQAWVWRRAREPGTVDWRKHDPHGTAFREAYNDQLCSVALGLAARLQLTVSVQDWLETDHDLVFLEVNPQGAWLFMAGAHSMVVPTLAAHLRSPGMPDQGTWPRPLKRFFWDFLPNRAAPANDGVVAPTFESQTSLQAAPVTATVLDVARRAHSDARAGATTAEDKASRLVQVSLALLTVALALATFQLRFALDRNWPWLLSLIPISIAIACIALATFESLEIDRVGVYQHPSTADLSGLDEPGTLRELIDLEEQGHQLASWTSQHKHSDLMQARAWFSRGLAALIAAALIAGSAQAASASASTTPALKRTGVTTNHAPSSPK